MALQALEARADKRVKDDKITGTPTFIVGEKTLDGEQTLAQLSAAIAAAIHR